MTEALPLNGMQHAFVHDEDAASLLTPPSLSMRLPPPPSTTNQEQSPPSSQPSASTNSVGLYVPSTENTFPPATDRESTPPSSALSSQEHNLKAITRDYPAPERTGSQTTVGRAAKHETESTRSSTGSPSRGDVTRETLSGPKRTASGEIKRSSITGIQDLKAEHGGTRHSRTSSILSNGSNGSVMEVHTTALDP